MIEGFSLLNNNPGNVRYTGIQWYGLLGKNKGFCVFNTALNGTRVIGKIWRSYLILEGVKTVREGISKWAPPSENNTEAYISEVCEETGLGPDDPIPQTLEVLRNLIAGIIKHEIGGPQWSFYVANRGGYSTIESAITLAGWTFDGES